MVVFLIICQVEKRPLFDLLPRRGWNTGLEMHIINTYIKFLAYFLIGFVNLVLSHIIS